ncbi:hypothetical protein GGS23DRAFT_547510 [Durotheca rogersii]|uniref:uncharacterized protein n=1 Tax=Durotheca rogersii TaxID=419775 RepID=UPI00221F2334|nr:uncharacterized protein GGS23DRAFT_547510 [Durotheca rogersii]KAI5867248.1 hypothetical protein GGS23DRAFT_547510 [Durotheca rogersii]
MRVTHILAAAVGLFAAVEATTGEHTAWTTVFTTDYTTYCPSPTTFSHHNVTYTATSETTITVTNCPCTVTYTKPPPITKSYTKPPPITKSYTKPTWYPTGSISKSSVLNSTYTQPPPPPPTTTLTSGTRTPPPPTSSPTTIATAAAERMGPVGALIAVGLAALAL